MRVKACNLKVGDTAQCISNKDKCTHVIQDIDWLQKRIYGTYRGERQYLFALNDTSIEVNLLNTKLDKLFYLVNE